MARAQPALLCALLCLSLGCEGDPPKGGDTSVELASDLDGDGFDAPEDCDDNNAGAYPDAEETCDGADNDCDGKTDEEGGPIIYRDLDGDGYGGDTSMQADCDWSANRWSTNSDDCDDGCETCFPGGEEICDGDDNDCDGEIDEDFADELVWYDDEDGDGYGDPSSASSRCGGHDAPVLDGTDCDDACADCHPGAEEVCDGDDNDCDGSTDEDLATYQCYPDEDWDGYGDVSATPTSSCDSDCGLRSTTLNTDCDDADRDINPEEAEECDLIDQDCDGEVDEGYEVGTVYRDADGDGYGDPDTETWGCVYVAGYVTDSTDCGPESSRVHPGADETCNTSDDDCDGEVDEGLPTVTEGLDADGDGYGDPHNTREVCALEDGWVADTADCGPYDVRIHPGLSEDCDNGRDDDCDGLMDCEDDDCTTERTCGEHDCSDGADDDDDGFTDCDDDECWGDPSCPGVIVSWVGMAGMRTTGLSREVVTPGSSCDASSSVGSSTADCSWWEVSSIAGSARVYTPGDTAGEACAWGATRAGLRRCVTRTLRAGVVSTTTASSAARSGFWVDGDCGLDATAGDESGFLPALDTLDVSSWYGEGVGVEHLRHTRSASVEDCAEHAGSMSITSFDEGGDGQGAVYVWSLETTDTP